MTRSVGARALVLSLVILSVFLIGWHVAVSSGGGGGQAVDPEYAKLVGAAAATGGQTPMPGRSMSAGRSGHVSDPFYVRGTNDMGIGSSSPIRWRACSSGSASPVLVAVPLGFLIGMSPIVYRALDPFIQVMKPISPLAWMPLALYTIKDSPCPRSSSSSSARSGRC